MGLLRAFYPSPPRLRPVGAAVAAAQLWVAAAAFGFVPEQRWSSTASGGTGATGSPIKLTWSIVPDGTHISGEGPSDLIQFFDEGWGAGPGGTDLSQRPWFSLLASSFDRWSQIGGLTFTYEPHDDGIAHGGEAGILGVRGDIRLGGSFIDGGGGTLAYNYFPNNADAVIDTGDASYFTNPTHDYRAFRNTLMHELGHGLGLDHVVSNNAAFLMEPAINISFEGPQLDDIRGIHWYYGDAFEKAHGGAGNGTATRATPLGQIPDDAARTLSVGRDAAGDLIVEPTDVDFVSISNLGDADYFSFEVSAPAALNAVVTPWGGVFNQGVQGGSQSQFDANSRSNLAIALFDMNGTSLLAYSDDSPAGAVEMLTGVRLPAAGRYFARVTGSNEHVQFYQLDLTAVAPAALLAGDFNQDGVVDAADYLVWRTQQGQAGPNLSADANHDLIVNDLDRLVWRTNFGDVLGSATSLAGSAVPEPPSIFLFVTMTFLGIRRRK